jgi:hypothetical protein
MISCTEFIPAYSELFAYLEARGGERAVLDFWEHLAHHFLGNLRELVERNGIRGCWLYWERTLNEEAADFTMELDEQAGEFTIAMHRCPSKGMLLELGHIQPYHAYCRHCDVLYACVLDPLGYECVLDTSECDRAACRLTVRKRSRHSAAPAGRPAGDQ